MAYSYSAPLAWFYSALDTGGTKPFEVVKRSSQEAKRPFPLEAPIELMASAHYESFLGGGSCISGGGTGALRIRPSW